MPCGSRSDQPWRKFSNAKALLQLPRHSTSHCSCYVRCGVSFVDDANVWINWLSTDVHACSKLGYEYLQHNVVSHNLLSLCLHYRHSISNGKWTPTARAKVLEWSVYCVRLYCLFEFWIALFIQFCARRTENPLKANGLRPRMCRPLNLFWTLHCSLCMLMWFEYVCDVGSSIINPRDVFLFGRMS